ncbi:hypothetical protein VTO42DRAFT_2270 [Malbranchea cinnamomea]
MACLRTTSSLSSAAALFLFLSSSLAQQDTYPPEFNGWYLSPSAGTTVPVAVSCVDGFEYVTSGSYVNCCNAQDETCQFATRCDGSTIVYANGVGVRCATGLSCYSLTLFQTFPAGEPRYTDVFCADEWDANTIYRFTPTSSDVATSAVTTEPPKVGSETTDFIPTPTSTPSSPSDPEDDDGGMSAGAIAGAVVGPVVGVALIAVILWLLRHKIKGLFGSSPQPQYESTQQQDQQAAPVAGGAYHDDVKQQPPVYGYYGSPKQTEPSELDDTVRSSAIYELPAPVEPQRPVSQELPASSVLSPTSPVGYPGPSQASSP